MKRWLVLNFTGTESELENKLNELEAQNKNVKEVMFIAYRVYQIIYTEEE